MAAWSAVVSAIITRVEAALPSVDVVRGQDVSEDPDGAVFIALQDVDDEDWTSAGTFRQTMHAFGGSRAEEGSVNCLVLARDGGGDQSAATDTAIGYLAAIEADVRNDKTLGLPVGDGQALAYMVAEMDSGEIRELQADDGASTALPFVITYKTVIN